MKNITVVIVAALGLAVAGAIYFAADTPDQPATPSQEAVSDGDLPAATPLPIATQSNSPPRGAVAAQSERNLPRAASADPRLAALMVSPDNGLIEFVPGADGRVIKEIDKDPNSLGFKKPLREYTYTGGKVTGLTSYQYFGDHVQITKTAVSYKPDGSVDQYLESTDHDYGKKKS